MLTARDDVADKVNALGLGADDYVPKPFSFDELVARIRAVLRRHTGSQELLSYSDLELNQVTHEVHRNGKAMELTMREYDLLLMLMRHPRQVLTRDRLLEQVWGYDADLETNVLEVHMGHLRQKLEAHGGSRVIQTIRGVGYVLKG
jgi:DNA-binding response OmpR family regulator